MARYAISVTEHTLLAHRQPATPDAATELLGLSDLATTSDTPSAQQRSGFAEMARAITGFSAPLGVLDRRAFTTNVATLRNRADGVPLRVASKSVRSVPVLHAVLRVPGFQGVLAYSLRESIWLVRDGLDDVVVAYPSVDTAVLTELISDQTLSDAITLMVDHPDHLGLLASVHRQAGSPPHRFRVCLDLDCSYRFAGLHLGTRRSPIHHRQQAVNAARAVIATPALNLVGIMGYEAQVAGVNDTSPAVRMLKKLSVPELTARRGAAVSAIGELTELEFVNGGGTGSVESTRIDPSVTEITVGSGLYASHYFDHYTTFTQRPATYFVLDITRIPAPGYVTAAGGGWIASGAPGPDRLPVPVYPEGLRLTSREGAGEVQTPMTVAAGHQVGIGDRVWMRHTKAGELCEHLNELHVVDGADHLGVVTTYRGEGQMW